MIALAFILVAGGWLLLYSGITNRDPREELSAALRGSHAPERAGIATTTTTGATGVAPSGLSSAPYAGEARIIGRPGQGTHSYSKPPNNWQSDNADDIQLPEGTPLYAPFSGTIIPGFGFDEMGGFRINLSDRKTGQAVYLAHLKSFAPGILLGVEVTKGQLLGYSGATGNAKGTTPHLHLAAIPPFHPDAYINGVLHP